MDRLTKRNQFTWGGWLLWMGLGAVLLACGDENTPQSCDFTEKLLNVSIDEQRELLWDETSRHIELDSLEAVVAKEEAQRLQVEALINEARPSGSPFHHEPSSKKAKVAIAKIDLLQRLGSSSDLSDREHWLTLYNHLRWGQFITARDFVQECDRRVVLQPESTPYQSQAIESNFIQGTVEAIGKKNLYYAYSTKDEIDHLNDSTQAYRFLQQKKGRGFSTGFFVEHVQSGAEWKVKVGMEAYREALATRLSWALGFYVDEVFHVRELRVEFDEDLERLFEAKGRKLEDSLAGIILKDGTLVDLVVTPEKLVDVSGIYRSHRGQIRYLLFKSVILERRDPNIVRVGQWSFDALDNPNLRATRMLGLLTFWLSNKDIKFDNNRIFLRCRELPSPPLDEFKTCVEQDTYQYQFSIHDLGLSFSRNPNDFNAPGNDLDMRREGNGLTSIMIRTRGRDVFAWQSITQEDAEAFAERLAQLTERQFHQALAASGYPYPAIVMLGEQLRFRQNRFLQFVAPERFAPVDTDLSVSSMSSGFVDIGDSVPLSVPQDGFVLVSGRLVNDISLGNHGRHSEMLRE